MIIYNFTFRTPIDKFEFGIQFTFEHIATEPCIRYLKILTIV